MKKLSILLAMFMLIGCSNTTQPKTENTVEKQSTEVAETKEQAEETIEVPAEEVDEAVGKVEESEIGKRTTVKSKKGINQTYESGPIFVTLKDVQIAEIEVDESAKEMFNNKDRVTAVIIALSVENTSDETISIYPDQGTIVTNTKEQKEAHIWFSDSVGGDFIGQVIKEGNVIFLLDSPAEEISHIKYVIGKPHDVNLDNRDWNDIVIELDI